MISAYFIHLLRSMFTVFQFSFICVMEGLTTLNMCLDLLVAPAHIFYLYMLCHLLYPFVCSFLMPNNFNSVHIVVLH